MATLPTWYWMAVMRTRPNGKEWVVSVQNGGETTERRLEVARDGDSKWNVCLDGTEVVVDALRLPHGGWSLLINGRSTTIDIEKRLQVTLFRNRHWTAPVQVADARFARTNGGAASTSNVGPIEITAPMPGKVVRVLVSVGQRVQSGEGLIIVEAMKMENELRTNRAGVVTAVHAVVGSTVEAGTTLIVVDSSAGVQHSPSGN